MRERVAAIIVKNGKILLVSDDISNKFYPPGGKIEEGESHEEALTRELKEELNVKLISSKFLIMCEGLHVASGLPQKEYCYLVKVKGSPTLSKEIFEIRWLSKKGLLNGNLPMFDYYKKSLFPFLEKEGHIR